MSFYDDCHDSSRAPWYWLFEIDLGGVTRGFSSGPELSLGDRCFIAGMTIGRFPQQGISIYDRTSSAATAQVVLEPMDLCENTTYRVRPCDLQDEYGTSLLGADARMYRVPHTAQSIDDDDHLIIRGHVAAASVTPAGELILDIEDFSVFYDRRILPQFVVDLVKFTGAGEDGIGQRLPVCYGTFTGVECPNGDDTSDTHLFGNRITVSAVTVADVAKTPTSVTYDTTTFPGWTITAIDLPDETADKTVVVSGAGPVDDVEGTYSGVASALLTDIADQLWHFIEVEAGVPRELIDTSSFVEVRSLFGSSPHALVLEGSDTSMHRVVAESAGALGVYLFQERGLLRLGYATFGASAVETLKMDENLVSLSDVAWTDFAIIPAGIEIGYGRAWNEKKTRFENMKKRVVEASEHTPFQVSKDRGGAVMQWDAPHIQDDGMIESVVSSIIALYAKERRTFEAVVNREVFSVRLLDTVALYAPDAPGAGGLGFSDKLAIVTGIVYGLDTQTLTLVEC